MPTSMLSVSRLQRRGFAPQQTCSRRHRSRATTAVVSAMGLLFVVAAVVTPGLGAFTGGRADIVATRLHSVIAARAESGGTALADLQVGQSLKCLRVKDYSKQGYHLQVGAERLGFIEMGELQEGFPSTETVDKMRNMKKVPGAEFDVRVLDKTNENLYLTMRSGDLTRPPRKLSRPSKVDEMGGLMDLGPQAWLEGEVVGVNILGAMVLLVDPTSSKEITLQLSKEHFTESFLKECTRGAMVRVRISGKDENGQPIITMKDA